MPSQLQICPPASRWRGFWLVLALLGFSLQAGGQNLPSLNSLSVKFAPQHADSIDAERAASEFGDLLFSLVNFARFAGINPEEALERTNRKFIQRFQYLETEAARDGHQLTDLTLAEMDTYWERAKRLPASATSDRGKK